MLGIVLHVAEMDVITMYMGQKGLEENKGLGRVAVPSMGHLSWFLYNSVKTGIVKIAAVMFIEYIMPLFHLTLTDDTSCWLVYHMNIAHTASHPHNISGK